MSGGGGAIDERAVDVVTINAEDFPEFLPPTDGGYRICLRPGKSHFVVSCSRAHFMVPARRGCTT
jgi:hypothetical protein